MTTKKLIALVLVILGYAQESFALRVRPVARRSTRRTVRPVDRRDDMRDDRQGDDYYNYN